jgi:hypothetical protein
MKTIETNKLIAEFMGGTLSSVPNLINLPQTRGDANIHSVKGSGMLPNGTYSVHRLNELKYHSSWDWLMPVVEKCYDNGAEENEIGNITHALLDCNKDHLYISVVEFIKEYNKDYKTCDRCCFDIVDDDGDIMEHICIDDKLY